MLIHSNSKSVKRELVFRVWHGDYLNLGAGAEVGIYFRPSFMSNSANFLNHYYKHTIPLPQLKSFDDIEVIHEYHFYTNQYDVFQMNQLRYPCENYSIRVILAGLDSSVFPVVSSCSQYNVYSSSLFASEQYKGSTIYSINLPKWSLPGSGYFLTLQRKD